MVAEETVIIRRHRRALALTLIRVFVALAGACFAGLSGTVGVTATGVTETGTTEDWNGIGESAIEVTAGETRLRAQILGASTARVAHATSPSQPGHAHARAHAQA